MKLVLSAICIGVVTASAPPRIELSLGETLNGTFTHDASALPQHHFHGVRNTVSQCSVPPDSPCFRDDIKSKREYTLTCEIRDESNEKKCSLPQARAYDHYGGDLNVSTTIFLVDNNENDESYISQEKSNINWQHRGRYLIYYDAEDKSGNHAEQVVLQVVLDDHEAPKFDANCVDETEEAANTEFKFCKLNATDNCIQENQTALNNRIKYTLKRGEVDVGTYPGASYALASTWLTTYWLRCDASGPIMQDGKADDFDLGTFTVTATVNDLAGPFGEGDQNNNRTTSFDVTFVDSTPPTIHLQGLNPYHYECDNIAADQNWEQYRSAGIVENGHPITSLEEVQKAGNLSAFTSYQALDQGVKFVDTRDDVCKQGKTLSSDGHEWDLHNYTASTVVESTVGNYTVTYSHRDLSGLPAANVTRDVIVQDTTPPQVYLMGNSSSVEFWANTTSQWVDPWALCADSCTDMPNLVPGSTSEADVFMDDPRGYAEWLQCPGSCTAGKYGIDNKVPGTYIRQYTCIDGVGNRASVNRTITIVDEDAPIITITKVNDDNVVGGNNAETLILEATQQNDNFMKRSGHPTEYRDAGAVCADYHDTKCNHGPGKALAHGECPQENQTHGRQWDHSNMDVGYSGSQLAVVSEVRFTPEISGASGPWQEFATGAVDVDLTQIGLWEVRYNCTDLAGNHAISKTRSVTVQDTRCPFLDVDAQLVYIEAGFDYHDQQPNAFDSLVAGSQLPASAVTRAWKNNKNPASATSKPGEYVLTFQATDNATNTVRDVTSLSKGCGETGTKFSDKCSDYESDRNRSALIGYGCGNQLDEQKRTVVVKDTLPPVIYLKLPGSNLLNKAQVEDIEANGRKGIGNGELHANTQPLENSAAADSRRSTFSNDVPYVLPPNAFSTRRRLAPEAPASRQVAAGALIGIAAGAALLALTKRRSNTHVPV